MAKLKVDCKKAYDDKDKYTTAEWNALKSSIEAEYDAIFRPKLIKAAENGKIDFEISDVVVHGVNKVSIKNNKEIPRTKVNKIKTDKENEMLLSLKAWLEGENLTVVLSGNKLIVSGWTT
jgi:hypothetical protein